MESLETAIVIALAFFVVAIVALVAVVRWAWKESQADAQHRALVEKQFRDLNARLDNIAKALNGAHPTGAG